MNILVVYTAGEIPLRKTVSSFLFSFRRFSQAQIYYHNISLNAPPAFYNWIKFDAILYTQFMTTPWNPKRYIERIEHIKSWKFRSGVPQIAFFQDEYFHGDLLSRFINELNIQHVFSVAYPSEWTKIYADVDPKTHQFHEYLTGYLDEEDRQELRAEDATNTRPIDVGYRTGWPSKEMYKLGYWGSLKFKIAEQFLAKASSLKLDIEMGKGFILGNKWFDFLRKCRYTIGVESGGSLLDYDGKVTQQIAEYLRANPKATYEETEARCFPGMDGNLKLRAISPRIFEAALCQTGMALIEGHYNGILQAGTHYIAIREDFSNLPEVFEQMKDEDLRRKLVSNVNRDIVENPKYTYRFFVADVFKIVQTSSESTAFYTFQRVYELMQWTAVYLWTRKNIILKILRKS